MGRERGRGGREGVGRGWVGIARLQGLFRLNITFIFVSIYSKFYHERMARKKTTTIEHGMN